METTDHENISTNISVQEEDAFSRAQKRVFLERIVTDIRALHARYHDVNPPRAIHEKLKRFRQHEHHRFIRVVRGVFQVTLSGRASFWSGLKPRLKQAFWPDTEEDPTKRSRADHARRTKTRYYRGKRPASACASYGVVHGECVHRQVHLFVRYILLGASKLDAYLEAIGGDDALDPCTLRMLQLCVRNQWLPVASETALWDQQSRIATALDLLVVDVCEDKILLIEMKTGYESEEYTAHPTDPPMRAPMHQLPDCPFWRHQLQLWATQLILARSYHLCVDQAWIVLILPRMRGIHAIPLHDALCTDRARAFFLETLERGTPPA